MERKEHLAFHRRYGAGKTSLAISPAVARAESERRIYSVTLSALIAALQSGHGTHPPGAAGHVRRRLPEGDSRRRDAVLQPINPRYWRVSPLPTANRGLNTGARSCKTRWSSYAAPARSMATRFVPLMNGSISRSISKREVRSATSRSCRV